MEKTKFWCVDYRLFTKKIEAQFYKKTQEENCVCREDRSFIVWNHKSSSGIEEIGIATILKDKKYRKFLDSKLIELIKEKDIKETEKERIEREIAEVEFEQCINK